MHGAGVEDGWDVVLIARRGLIGSDYWDIERSVRGLLRRAGIGARGGGAGPGPAAARRRVEHCFRESPSAP